MNLTVWNGTEEMVGSFILAAFTLFVHGYAIFLSYAIYDYQDEKPTNEKSPTDILIKDLKNTEFWCLYFSLLVQFISLFTPPITSLIVYYVSYINVFSMNFYSVSWLVSNYIQYIHIFHHELVVDNSVSAMRWKVFGLKLFITFLSLLLNIAVPYPETMTPIFFQILSKGSHYER